LSEARLQFVVGKGGVGKSTLTAALALASASRGQRTLAIEFGGRGGLSRLFGVTDAPVGEARVVRPGLTILALGGDEALAEYLRLVIPIKRLLSAVFASRLYRVFVAAAPGLKELMTVGKVWFEADRRLADGEPAWERIFVDAGASGHSLQYLQMPAAAAATFRTGLVHREATRVQALLADPESTCVHVVATPEEMPVTEASSIVARLRDPLCLPVGTLFLNRCRLASPPGVAEALALLDHLDLRDGDRVLGEALREAARSALGWEAVQETAAARIAKETGLDATRLPLLVRDEFGLAEAGELAALLDATARTGGVGRTDRQGARRIDTRIDTRDDKRESRRKR
jgi:anion-transporting  ArsA/GET3 family ATPase